MTSATPSGGCSSTSYKSLAGRLRVSDPASGSGVAGPTKIRTSLAKPVSEVIGSPIGVSADAAICWLPHSTGDSWSECLELKIGVAARGKSQVLLRQVLGAAEFLDVLLPVAFDF